MTYTSIPSNYNKLLKNTVTTIKDEFWYDNIEVLFKLNRIDEFFPTTDMSIEEKLNSLVRLSIYISLILTSYSLNSKYLYIAIIVMVLTAIIYINRSDDVNEHFQEKEYVRPTKNNKTNKNKLKTKESTGTNIDEIRTPLMDKSRASLMNGKTAGPSPIQLLFEKARKQSLSTSSKTRTSILRP